MTAPHAPPASPAFATRVALAVAVPLFLVLLAYALRAAFHSDELNVLHHVGRFAQGEFRAPSRPGLLWLALTPLMLFEHPVALLQSSRVVAVGAVGLGVACIVALGRQPTTRLGEPPSWVDRLLPAVAVALLLTSGSFAPHAIEVRTDTFTTPLTLLALVILWRRPWTPRTTAMAAVVVAAAILCSQKSAYNAIGLAAAWLIARPARPEGTPWLSARARDAGIAVLLVGLLVAGWFALLTLAAGTGGELVATNLERAASTAFSNTISLAEKRGWLKQAFDRAPLLYVGASIGLLFAAWRARRDGRVLASACVAAVMLGVIGVHRGFFPYYIASIEPFLALPAALAVLSVADGTGWALAKAKVPRGLTVGLVTLLAVGWATKHQLPALQAAWGVTSEGQMGLAKRVHALYGEPTPYVAGLNLVPGYPETAGYLTADARLAKRNADKHFIATRLQNGARFFIRAYMTRDVYLKNPERAVLYRSYVPVSPNLYVHGARARWKPGTTEGQRVAEVFVDGPYTVRFRQDEHPPLTVDGKSLAEGDVIELTAGDHRVTVGPATRSGEVWLVLGEDIEVEAPGTHVDYSLFPKDRSKSRMRYQRYDKKKGKYDLALRNNGPQRIARHQRRLRELDAKWEKQVLVTRLPEPEELDEAPPGAETAP